MVMGLNWESWLKFCQFPAVLYLVMKLMCSFPDQLFCLSPANLSQLQSAAAADLCHLRHDGEDFVYRKQFYGNRILVALMPQKFSIEVKYSSGVVCRVAWFLGCGVVQDNRSLQGSIYISRDSRQLIYHVLTLPCLLKISSFVCTIQLFLCKHSWLVLTEKLKCRNVHCYYLFRHFSLTIMVKKWTWNNATKVISNVSLCDKPQNLALYQVQHHNLEKISCPTAALYTIEVFWVQFFLHNALQ